MADNKQSTAHDRKLISLTEEYEVRDWCKSLGSDAGNRLSERPKEKLIDASGSQARATGTSARQVV